MTRFSLLAANLAVGLAAAALMAMAVGGLGITLQAFLAAVRLSWWAGLSVGISVGFGAAAGRRPVLPFLRCLAAQAGAFAGSVVGGWIGSLFPGEVAEMDRAVRGLLAQRGIVAGAGIGTALGILWQVYSVYRLRRRAEEAGPK